MSETADYNPGKWSGHDFNSARRVYDNHVRRSYGDAVKANKGSTDLIPDSLTTNSPAPLVILCDVTGSMGEWPATMFSKLPYLEHEAKEYLGKDMEIAWGAIGDAMSNDQYPFQIREFAKDTEIKDKLKELIIEGRGGGGQQETYEIAALYCARNINMPNAIKPICIIIGDEGFYNTVNKDLGGKFAKTAMPKRLNASDVWEELKQKFAVYLIRKPYRFSGTDDMSPTDKAIYAQWEKVLGADHISILPEAGRVVDTIFGILAKETDKIKYFKEEIKERQKPHQVETVMKSLKTIHKIDMPEDKKLLKSGASKMRNASKGKKTKSLL